MSSIGKKVADFAHRGVVFGLMGFFGAQVYQIGRNVSEGVVDSPYMHSTYFQDVEKKIREEYTKDNVIDKRDWFQAEDDSYLKNQVRANITTPEFKKGATNTRKEI